MRMKQLTAVFAMLFFAGTIAHLNSQAAVLSTGGDATGSGGSAAYSVGQVAYTNFSGEAGSISLGVQQPHFVIMVGTEDPEAGISALLYPNPANDFFRLKLDNNYQEEIATGKLSMRIYNVDGKLILQQDILELITNVSLANFGNAFYLVRIIRDNAEIKTFKIFKTN